MAAPRQSPPPSEPTEASALPSPLAHEFPAAGTTSAPMKNSKAGTSGRISRVFWMKTGCAARNSPVRRPTLRFGHETSDANDENNRERRQHERDGATEEQKTSGGFKGLVDRKPMKERRQREVVPGRVMLEEVPVWEQALEHAPGRMGMLELVRVEDPTRDQRDARNEEGRRWRPEGERSRDGDDRSRARRSARHRPVASRQRVATVGPPPGRQVISSRAPEHGTSDSRSEPPRSAH